jgi:hypothetical protein
VSLGTCAIVDLGMIESQKNSVPASIGEQRAIKSLNCKMSTTKALSRINNRDHARYVRLKVVLCDCCVAAWTTMLVELPYSLEYLKLRG